MVNYAVTDYITNIGSLREALADLETYLETVDNTKTIYLVDVKRVGGGYQGIVIHLA